MNPTVALAVVALGASVAWGDVLYSLGPPDPNVAFASDSVPGQFNNQRLGERFTLAQPAEVMLVRWWGGSENAFFPDLRNMETFSIAIHAEAASLPGTRVHEVTVAVSSTGPTAIGMRSNGAAWYRHEFTFAQPVALSAGAYWLSVGTANTDPDGDGWYWSASQSIVSDNFAAQAPANTGSWRTSGFADLAFTIEGSAIPSPAAMPGLLAGAALTLRRRRRVR